VEKAESTIPFNYLMAVPVVVFILGAMLIYLTGTPWQLISDSFIQDFMNGTAWAVLTFASVILLTRFPISQSLREVCRELLPIFEGIRIWQIVALSMAAGIGEELMFRGFLQQWLAGYYTAEAAIGFASVIFGLLHFFTFSYFLLTTVLGAAMGIAYHITGSLILVMSWHALYDLLVIWILARRPELLGISNPIP
jgi:membrane protease YdiL (CAAX protease family)